MTQKSFFTKGFRIALVIVIIALAGLGYRAMQHFFSSSTDMTMTTVVKNGDVITVDYVGKLTDGKIFDTSIQTVAEEAGLFNPHRDYSEGLTFTVGAGQMIAGFDAGVLGMRLGETKTVTIPAAEAYGEARPELKFRVLIESVGDISAYKVGDRVYLGNGMSATISDLTDTEIEFDANHELAGKDLVFDITLKNISESTMTSSESSQEQAEVEAEIQDHTGAENVNE